MEKFYSELEECRLCPKKCGINRTSGAYGICGCKSTLRVSRAAPHFGEEPCISGTYGSGTVFFSGCNLGCVFCQNRKISRENFGFDISEEKLSDVFIELQNKNVHNINLVTPTPWVPQIKNSLDMAWQKGLFVPVIYNCGGYESVDTIKSLRGYIGIYMPDFKYIDPKLSQRFSGVKDYPETAKRALYEMVEQRGNPIFDGDIMLRGVIVRHLILPGYIENTYKTLEYLNREYRDGIYISIMNQYTQMNYSSEEPKGTVSDEQYAEIIRFAKNIGIKNAFIQESGAVGKDFIPDFDGTGVL